MEKMYDGSLQWVPDSEGIIPNDKYGFIVETGLRAFAKDVANVALCSAYRFDTFSEFVAEQKRWFNLPDDWSFEQFMGACRHHVEAMFFEEHQKAVLREAERKAKAKEEEKGKKKKEAKDD